MITCLLQGLESPRKIEILLTIGQFTSQPVKDAMHLHLDQGKGYNQSMAQMTTDIKQQQFSRALKRLNEINSLVEEITTLKCCEQKQQNKTNAE